MMLDFFKENADGFTWKPLDLQGIDLEVIIHKLNIDPNVKPVKQKKRNFGVERNKVIEANVNKLLEAGYIVEI